MFVGGVTTVVAGSATLDSNHVSDDLSSKTRFGNLVEMGFLDILDDSIAISQ